MQDTSKTQAKSGLFKGWSFALVALLLAGCLPDENKAPDQVSDAGKLSGGYYASALGNTAVLIQSAVVTNPTWFNATNGQSITLGDIGIDPQIGIPVGNAVCPAVGTPRVTLLTWLDSRKPDNTFLLKGAAGGVGEMMASLRTRLSMDQLGTYEANGNIRLADGSVMNVPSTCSVGMMNIPVGAPVVAFVADKPSAPINEMTRTEYRTRPCGPDPISGLQQNGTAVESRKVGFKSDGTIVTYVNGVAQPYNPLLGWSTEDMGQCIPAVSVDVANTTRLNNQASTALNNFADFAAQGMRDALQNQLQFDCVKANVSSKTVNRDTGQLIEGGRVIDTCRKTALTNTGATNVDNIIGDPLDVRNLCPRAENGPRNMLGRVDGVFSANMAGNAIVRRTVQQIDSVTDSAVRGNLRYIWTGGQRPGDVNCSGRELFRATCGVVPGAPTGKLEDTTVEKWITKNLNELDNFMNGGAVFLLVAGGMMYSAAAMGALAVFGFLGIFFMFLGLLFMWSTDMGSSRVWLFNYNFLNTIHTYHVASDTTQARRDLSTTEWQDPYNYFIANFHLPAGTLGWYVPPSTNACRIMERENQRKCPQNYNASKEDARAPRVLNRGEDFKITILPGGDYGSDEAGDLYNKLRSAGFSVGLVKIKQTKPFGCGFLGLRSCTRWLEAGPGTDAYLESWTRSNGTSSVTGGTSTVQTILMNKDGQKKDWTPTILNGPLLRYKDKYSELLLCGRIEHKVINWPARITTTSCNSKGCNSSTSNGTVPITEKVVREWEGESDTNGTWSKPKVVYTSAYGNWNSLSDIPARLNVNN